MHRPFACVIPAWSVIASIAWAQPTQTAPGTGTAREAASPTPVVTEPTVQEPQIPPAAASAAVEAPKWTEMVVVGGLVDTFYSLRLRGTAFDRSPSELRVFDGNNGTFNLAYVELNAAMKHDPVGLRFDLGFGRIADLTSLEVDPSGTTGASEVFKHIQQAYATIQLPFAGATLDAGKFVTSAGAEVIEAKDNWLYTRSVLFGYAIPFTHTGVRLSAPVGSEVTIQTGVLNGWDLVDDNQRQKTLNLSLLWTGAAGTTAVLNLYTGPEGLTGDWRHLVDVVLAHPVNERLSVNLNVDYGAEAGAAWYGAALMGRYIATEWMRLAARLEYFRDRDGVRTLVPGGISTLGLTAGAGFPIGHKAELRAEARFDRATVALYDGGTTNKQPTFHIAALAWF